LAVDGAFIRSEKRCSANGSLSVFAIPIDLDASRAQPHWKKEDGSLDCEKIQAKLIEFFPQLEKYLAYFTRSSGGLGLSLVFGIKHLPLMESTFINQQMYSLSLKLS
jgi:hypothetical protein